MKPVGSISLGNTGVMYGTIFLRISLVFLQDGDQQLRPGFVLDTVGKIGGLEPFATTQRGLPGLRPGLAHIGGENQAQMNAADIVRIVVESAEVFEVKFAAVFDLFAHLPCSGFE